MRRAHGQILILWLAGVVAAAQLAKIAALMPTLRATFGLSLTEAGMLISLIEVGGAVFGFVAGLALGAIDASRALTAGLLLLAAASIAEALAASSGILFAARAVEGLGYLLVVIAAPTLIVGATQPGVTRNRAMGLWSTFVPVGLGVGSVLTAAAMQALGSKGAILFWAATLVIVALLARNVVGARPPRRAASLPGSGAWLLSAGFGCYTLSLCATTGLLPTYLSERFRLPPVEGGSLAGLVAVSALPGAVLALAAMRSMIAARRTRCLSLLLAILPAATLAPLVYRTGTARGAVLLAALALLSAGVARTLLFARLPAMSGPPGEARVAAAQGVLTQFGAAGALLGPPLGAAIVQHWGWWTLGVLSSAAMLLMLGLLLAAEYSKGSPA